MGARNGSKPREYPAEIVALVERLYTSGMTVAEVQAAVPRGYKVQLILKRYGIPARRATPRNQRGPANASWKGDAATYTAFHLRVATARGTPSCCERCGSTDAARYEWANLTGRYEDVNDYERMCAGCHRTFDAQRRRQTGQRLTPPGLRR